MVSLNSFIAQTKRDVFDDLEGGRSPRLGAFDSGQLEQGRTLGAPRMGTTTLTSDTVTHEFLFGEGTATPLVFTVHILAPERIVFLPVPAWVIETIWQGEIAGSYVFASEAESHLATFTGLLAPEANAQYFGPERAKRRE